MSIRLINNDIIKTIFSNLSNEVFKSYRVKSRNKFILEKIIQRTIYEIDYLTKGQSEIILWYKNYNTKDRHVITLTVKDKINKQEVIEIKSILKFEKIFIVSTSNYIFKTDLKTISLIYSSAEDLQVKKVGLFNFMLLTNKEILLLNPYGTIENNLVVSKFKNPLNSVENIFVINSNNSNYVLKNSKNKYSIINISNHSDEKVLRLKGFEYKSLLDVLKVSNDMHLFIFETFIAKYNIKENQYLDLYTTKSKILDYFLNSNKLVLNCKMDNYTYILDISNFTIERKLIFSNEDDMSRFIVNDYIIQETGDDFKVYYKNFMKKKEIPKIKTQKEDFFSFKSFNNDSHIFTFTKTIIKNRLEVYCYSIKKDNIKLCISEIGDSSQLIKINHINERYFGMAFSDKFVIYDYKDKKISKVLSSSTIVYLGKFSNYKLLFYDRYNIYLYDLFKDSTFMLNFDLEDFIVKSSKYLVINKYLVYSEGRYLYIIGAKRDPYQVQTISAITGFYKHYYNNEIIVTNDLGFTIFSLTEKGFIGDTIALALFEIKIKNVRVNSRYIFFLTDLGRLITYNFHNGSIELRDIRRLYEDIVSVSETTMILSCKHQCDEISLADFQHSSRTYI
jgi:hypothetical protein